jgi:cysteine desulfuration protein SufE
MIDKSVQEIQDQIISDFSMLDNNREYIYNYIIEIGKKLPDLAPEHKKDENLIKGCQSKVWLVAKMDNQERVIFEGDSDTIIVKGLVSLLIQVLSGQTPHAILNAELYFVEKIGLKQIISSSRSNGFVAMIRQMKMYALAFQTQLERKAE